MFACSTDLVTFVDACFWFIAVHFQCGHSLFSAEFARVGSKCFDAVCGVAPPWNVHSDLDAFVESLVGPDWQSGQQMNLIVCFLSPGSSHLAHVDGCTS